MYFMAQLLENCTFKRRILFFGLHGLLFGLQWQKEKMQFMLLLKGFSHFSVSRVIVDFSIKNVIGSNF